MKILYLIPARGGSKGLPGKNIRLLAGKPLICYSIDAAREVAEDANICVSTDDKEIAEIVKHYGLKLSFMRPTELATDFATTEQVILHAIHYYETQGKYFDFVVILQPTSPLRNSKHINEALALINADTEMIVSVTETNSNPYYVLFEEDINGILQKAKDGNFSRRQDCPVIYELNGAIYIINVVKLKEKGLSNLHKIKYVMNKQDSIDIDDIIDFKIAEFIMNSNSINM